MNEWPRCSKETKDGKCGHPLPERVGAYDQEDIDIILTHYEEGRLIDGQTLAAAWLEFKDAGAYTDEGGKAYGDVVDLLDALAGENNEGNRV